MAEGSRGVVVEVAWDRSVAYARLGSSIRTMLLAPREGFGSAVKAMRHRTRLGRRPAEGIGPYVLASAGGAALLLLWLKVGGLTGLRSVASDDFRWSYVVASLVAGAVLGVAAQFMWGAVAPRIVGRLGGEASPGALRLVWGASALPQTLAIAILLPLDVAIAGRASYTTERISDPVATAWAAFSVALAVSLAVWSLWLFVRGVEVVGGITTGRATLGSALGVVAIAGAAIVFALVIALVAGVAG